MKHYPDKTTPMIIGALVIGVIPHLPYLPLWIIAWCFFSWTFSLVSVRYRWPIPPKPIRIFLALGAFSGIMFMSGKSFDSDSGVGLLCLMASLKPLEIQTHRDKMITLFLAYFMVAAGLFFSVSIEITLYMCFAVIIITTLLIRVNHPTKKPMAALKLSASITLQAIPLMLILFFMFPRFHGGLWGIQQRAKGATGFSDTLAPGSVTELVKNNAVAFRVSFPGITPEYKDLYWRGIVFHRFTGTQWKSREAPRVFRPTAQGNSPKPQSIILEPHDSKWIFALDTPGSIPRGFRMRQDNTVVSRRIITNKTRYEITSYLQYQTGALKPWEKNTNLLPKRGNEKSREFAKEIYRQSGSTKAYIEAVLNYFRNNGFTYTLKPPPLNKNPIDRFLFDTKKGYCEHYASAFAFLMRAAGVHARVVGGYMGGEKNPYGNYLIIRQSDAHAWTEVWIDGEGWSRIDPTSIVAPERLVSGVNSALPQDEVPEFLTKQNGRFFTNLQAKLLLSWDAINYQWHTKIISYTSRSQKNFLKKIGLGIKNRISWLKIALATLSLIAIISIGFYIRIHTSTGRISDPVTERYHLFLKKLDHAGISKPSYMGPLDFAEQASSQRKDLAAEINGITRLYILLKYGNEGGNKSLQAEFHTMVKKFKPGC